MTRLTFSISIVVSDEDGGASGAVTRQVSYLYATSGLLQPINAGGRKYEGGFGTIYSTNITPDPKTGIGSWTDEQIITAIRSGR